MSKKAPTSGTKKDTKNSAVSAKTAALMADTELADGQPLMTNQGLKINDDQHSLKAGARGPSLLEDFYLREKITHFDHERIPERAVHARGAGAHGYFQAYKSFSSYTKAGFLNDTNRKTPVFVRFSTVAGSRGSSDMARDVRGFAVKFYTEEGNFDLVGNNIPVFFIQDAIKFPDLIHAVKPEPHNEIPQAASAHDTFWDFISLMPESMHMIMWVMSDRAIPRSLRMMEGFGVHTFRLINEQNKACLVKFHWKPTLGVHSVLWDEALKISGVDPDFHRRDLFEAIEAGQFPEWELGVQIVSEKDAESFDFDLTDPTKLIPEELVPVTLLGKMVLNRNPDNYFAEVEQVAFHPGNVVPGIDFSNDPLLQGRLFSYTDTQLTRLGSPNFHEIPINRPLLQVHNTQRDGHMRQQINQSKVSYQPNTLGGGCPFQATMAEGGFSTYPEATVGTKIRARGPKFFDHYSQARLFWVSQSDPEQAHIVNALRFELSKVETLAIRERMVAQLQQVDATLAKRVAAGLGIPPTVKVEGFLNFGFPADADPKKYQSPKASKPAAPSPSLSMAANKKLGVVSRKVAILAADGVDGTGVAAIKKALAAAGAIAKIVAPHAGSITDTKGVSLNVDFTLFNCTSVLFDGVYIPPGVASVSALGNEANALRFIMEAYNHCKTIGASGDGVDLLRTTGILSADGGPSQMDLSGIIADAQGRSAMTATFLDSLGQHRHWAREKAKQMPV